MIVLFPIRDLLRFPGSALCRAPLAASARKALPGAREEGEIGGSSFRRRRKVFRGPCASEGPCGRMAPDGAVRGEAKRRCGFRETASSAPKEKASASDMAAQIDSRLIIAISSLFTLMRANEAWRSDSTCQNQDGSSLRGGDLPQPRCEPSKLCSAALAHSESHGRREPRGTRPLVYREERVWRDSLCAQEGVRPAGMTVKPTQM